MWRDSARARNNADSFLVQLAVGLIIAGLTGSTFWAAINGFSGVAVGLGAAAIAVAVVALVSALTGKDGHTPTAPSSSPTQPATPPEPTRPSLVLVVVGLRIESADSDSARVIVRIQNTGTEHLDKCLVKIDSLDASHWLRDGTSPIARQIRTVSQEGSDRWGRFDLAPGEWKELVVGVVHRRFTTLTLLHEGGKAYIETSPEPALVGLGLYGAPKPTRAMLSAEQVEKRVLLQIDTATACVDLAKDHTGTSLRPVDPRLDQISELWSQAFAIVEQMFKKNCYAARDAEAVNESARVMIATCERWLSENAVHQLTQVTAAKWWTTERNWNYGKNLKEQEANPNIHFDCLANHMVLLACLDALSTFEHQLKRASAPPEHE